MIEFVAVSKTYRGSRTSALRSVSVQISRGEFCLLVGPSGAGKSTFLRLISCDELPTEGKVVVGGQDIARLRRHQLPTLRRNLGVVFQDFRLLTEMSVFDNVAVALEVRSVPWRDIRPRVTEMLERVELSHLAHQRIGALSGGEQQRVAIARALVAEPELILCDEPTGNLDDDNARRILSLLDDAHARGATIVVATHDLPLFRGERRRTVELENGSVTPPSTNLPSTNLPSTTPQHAETPTPHHAADNSTDTTGEATARAAPIAGDTAAPATSITRQQRKFSVVK